MPMGDSAVSSQQPGTGQNRQPGNRDNSGNRARDNIGGNSTVTTTAVVAAIAVNDTVVTIGHTPLRLPPSISKGKNVMFLFGLIQENLLEDMSPTAQLDPDTLKELHDVQIPEVESAIQDCCDAAGKYTSRKGCDTVLVRRAQMVCESAYEWTCQVLARYRRDQYHLGRNTPTRNAPFSVFDPNGNVSVYELFMRLKEWSSPQMPRQTSCSPSTSRSH